MSDAGGSAAFAEGTALGVAGLVAVCSLLGWAAWAGARRWGRDSADRFWIFVACATCQLGVVAMLASAVKQFTPVGVLVTQILVTAAVVLVARRTPAAPSASGGLWGRASWPLLLAAALVLALMALSGARQAITPVWAGDEYNYHGPRMLYWLQQRSIFPFPTHNLRQTLFPWGSELVSVWPLLFVREEWPARMAFWVCFPVGAAGLWTVCRAIGLGALARWAAVSLWVATPAVSWRAESLKSDAWLAVYLLGAAYWLVSPRPERERPWWRFLWAGVFLALAVNVKTTAAAVLPAMLVVWWVSTRGQRRGAMAGFVVGGAAATVLSGLAVVLAYTTIRFGHPLGPPELRALVKPDMTWPILRTQAVRAALFLVEFPDTLTTGVREAVERFGARVADATGATAVLPGEEPLAYPGRFEYRLPVIARAYSTAGLLWFPVLLVGVIHIVRRLARREALDGVSALTLMAGCAIGALVLGVRWMGDGPNRFWLGAFALAVPVTAYFLRQWSVRSRVVAAVVCAGAVWTLYPALRASAMGLETAVRRPRTSEQLDEAYARVMQHIEPGAVILLIGGNVAREYPLFNPRAGFTNRVVSWAEAGFDPARTAALVEERGITHVVLERSDGLVVRWGRTEPVAPILEALRARADLREVDVGGPGPRLWVRETGGVRE